MSAAAPPTDAQLRAWVLELDSSSFTTREAASRHLAAAGQDARALLREARASSNPEIAWRADAILCQAGPDRPTQPERQIGSTIPSERNEQPLPSVTGPPPLPAAPPDSDIAQALAPPPSLPPLEAITDHVLIADAYVSPELSGAYPAATPADHPPIASQPSISAPAQPTDSPVRPAIASTLNNPTRARPAVAPVSLVSQPSLRSSSSPSREAQPRVLNFLQRARTALGFSSR